MNQIIRQSRTQTDRWWEDFYDDACMAVLADKDERQIQRECDTIVELLRLRPGDSVMDQCCGLGQYSIELASRGYNVVGIDQSPLYIEVAQDNADGRHVDVDFRVADALHFVHDLPVDCVMNWHSSFGYLPTDDDNLQMLKAAYRCLPSGGRMLLEYPNMLYLIANFRSVINTDLPDGLKLERQSQLSAVDGTLKQKWSYLWPDGATRSHHSRLRIYLPHQLIEMLHAAGFTSVDLRAGDGAELAGLDARCIVIGVKEQTDE